MIPPWSRLLPLHELARGPVTLQLAPNADERAAIARALSLKSLPMLTAEVTVKPWFDGVELSGRFKASVEQVCGVSLDAFEQSVEGQIDVRALPAGSSHATDEDAAEVELDLDAPDPPDVLEGDAVDLGAYVVEHFALEIDPFPRKPGAEFAFTPPAEDESPFAVLKAFKDPKT
jgi:uncharacterized metal-binding protein YceD (DUF177 family)